MISCYYKNSEQDSDRPIKRFISEVGIKSMKIIFFKICVINPSKPVNREAAAELEEFFMNKLSPSLNVATNSFLSDGGSGRGTRVFVYNKSITKLLYIFERGWFHVLLFMQMRPLVL